MKFAHLTAAALAVSSVSAWSWPSSLEDFSISSHVDSFLGKRQNNGNNNSNATSSANSVQSSAPASSNSDSQSASGSGSANPSDSTITSGAGSATSGATPTQSQNTSTVAINPQDPPGGIQMVTPGPTAASQYIKVDDTVTWVWNYTSLAITPNAIDILATVSVSGGPNPSPFTLALNQSVDPTQTFIWDTGKYFSQTSALPIGTYTLLVYDAQASAGYSAVPSAGYLAPYNQFRFGVYTPRIDAQATNNDLQYVCATCNGAGGLERLTVGALVGVATVTVTSFMWFAGGWGAFM